MVFEKREADVALEVARELQAEYGPTGVTAVEQRLASAGSGPRGFEAVISEVAAVASVIIGCIQVYLQLQDRQDRSSKQPDEVLKRLEEEAPEPDQLTKEKRLGIIKRVLVKLPPKAADKE